MDSLTLDGHLVAHDAAAILAGVLCGVSGGIFGESIPMGFMLTGSISALGITLMRIGSFRRVINRSALAVGKMRNYGSPQKAITE